jgi:hypothetical protein
MEYRFYDKNHLLIKAVELIRDFFEKNGFKVKVDGEGDSFTILSNNPQDPAFPRITVKVCCKQNFLSVHFLESDSLHSKMFVSSIFSLFGGSLFLSKDSKIRDKVDKLEEQFWKHIEVNL